VGVVFSHNGSAPQTVRARREVILAAGVIGSPQLLMLSGVGPRQHLTDLNVCDYVSVLLFTVFSCALCLQGILIDLLYFTAFYCICSAASSVNTCTVIMISARPSINWPFFSESWLTSFCCSSESDFICLPFTLKSYSLCQPGQPAYSSQTAC